MDYSGSRSDVKNEDGPFWHSGKMSYHCPRCNAGYTYKKTLKTHMKYDCGKEPRFKCPYCNKRDKCSSNIYKHVRVRHDDVRIAEWSNMATQATVSSYICPKCNAGFRRMWDLIRHKCGQTPRYACPYCQKKDNSSSNVYRHIRRWHPKMPVGVNKMF
ncbi:hypothetical protein KM043_007662 [Ampulex compressa]|nr:hypothetical protein KM043_007662 [Ampulex compressa]